jgi:hypothetical protein
MESKQMKTAENIVIAEHWIKITVPVAIRLGLAGIRMIENSTYLDLAKEANGADQHGLNQASCTFTVM